MGLNVNVMVDDGGGGFSFYSWGGAKPEFERALKAVSNMNEILANEPLSDTGSEGLSLMCDTSENVEKKLKIFMENIDGLVKEMKTIDTNVSNR